MHSSPPNQSHQHNQQQQPAPEAPPPELEEPIDGPPDVLLLSLRRHLPPLDTVHTLLTAYFERGTWLVRGPTRIQILDEIVPALYGTLPRSSTGPNDEDTATCLQQAHEKAAEAARVSHSYAGMSGAHGHALFFGILATAHLVLDAGPNKAGCDTWLRRAQAALVVRSVFDGPSLLTLQALHVLAVTMLMRQDGLDELAWSYQALASHLSITMGLRKCSGFRHLERKTDTLNRS
jgi:hypothetical protein